MIVLSQSRRESGSIGAVLENKLRLFDKRQHANLNSRMFPELRVNHGSAGGHFGEDDSPARAWAKWAMGIDFSKASAGVFVQLACGLCKSENLLAEEDSMFPGDYVISCLDCGATD